MQLDDVQQALAEAIGTGKLGTPVAARAHLQLVARPESLESVMSAVLEMLAPAFPDRAVTTRTREHPGNSQATILIQTIDRRTIFITIGHSAAKSPSLQLLVIGNHGMLRLEGGEGFAP